MLQEQALPHLALQSSNISILQHLRTGMAGQGLQHAPLGMHQAHLAEGLAQSQAEVVQLQDDLMCLHTAQR